VWHTVFTLFKRKGEKGQNKKYFAKKMERRKSKLLVLTGTHQKR
jgi:hypothetical protein